MKETRASVLLVRLAKKMRKETGDHRYRARVEDERASLSTLIYISCTRPVCECSVRWNQLLGSADLWVCYIDLLVTEPVIMSFTVGARRGLRALLNSPDGCADPGGCSCGLGSRGGSSTS